MEMALKQGRAEPGGHRLHQRPRHLDAARRRARARRGAPAVRQCHRQRVDELDQVGDRPPARRRGRGREHLLHPRACATRSSRRRSTSTIRARARRASTSCRTRPRSATVRAVLNNSFGFGGTNASLVMKAGRLKLEMLRRLRLIVARAWRCCRRCGILVVWPGAGRSQDARRRRPGGRDARPRVARPAREAAASIRLGRDVSLHGARSSARPTRSRPANSRFRQGASGADDPRHPAARPAGRCGWSPFPRACRRSWSRRGSPRTAA